VTAAQFRKIALELPETSESAHMDHPDFRVCGKIFATIGPQAKRGMLKLTSAQQSKLVDASPGAFEPFNGAWGRRGCTKVLLRAARAATVRPAMELAWRNTAPNRLVQAFYEREF
jgi:hypothetical protein